MSARALPGAALRDEGVAWIATAACGTGTAAAVFGATAASPYLALAGGALLCCGAAIVLAGRWIEPLIALAAVLAMPPLYSTDAVRISPALAMNALLLGAWLLRAGAVGPGGGVVRAAGHAVVPVRHVARAGAVLFAAVLLVAPFAADHVAAAREVFNWLLVLALLAFALHELAGSAARRRTLAVAIAVVGAVAGGLAVLETIGALPGRFPIRGTSLYRATLGFGWPNELGMFLALALPFAVCAIAAARTPFGRAAALLGAGLISLGLLATFSRASWLAVLIAPTALLAVGAHRTALRFWLAALVFAAVADTVSGGVLQARIASTIGDWVVEQRAGLTLAGLLMFAAHPIAGVGPGGFATALDDYGTRVSWLWDYLPTAQNGYVQMAAEAGIIGLAALVAFFVVVLRTLRRAARSADADSDAFVARAAYWSAATAVILAFNEWIFTHGIAQLVVLAIALGASVARPAPEGGRP